MTHLMQTYQRQPIAFVRGEGAYLWDTQGNKFLDAVAGVAVCGLGHAHPGVADAICDQARTLVHTSNLYQVELQERLAQQLCRVANMDSVFFGNSGAEANEAAIKLARLHGHNKKTRNPSIIVTEGSFHGRTLATLSATGNRKIQAGFEPLVSGFNRVPFNDVAAVRQVGDNNPDVVAVLVEPILGEGGIVIPAPGYLKALRALCTERGWLLMLDEIQTGMCRTGRWFAYQHEDARPDVMTLAKSLGNGVPIGACLASGAAASLFQPGNHGSTFGGTPLACRAALTVIESLEAGKLDARAATLGRRLLDGLAAALDGTAGVVQIRGKGLMIGIELDRPCAEVKSLALARGLLVNVTAEKVVRLLPPLVISDAEADRITSVVADSIRTFLTTS
ncbi:MAG: acetylornithine aminotransferase [Candidatus Muproteobacteria bacterium RBG_16_60_9]|uniref:Acetylornithine aminotransferase n=1 Tax=Candidatus Muproteobacteria bacterium RBG_16_60_9 TaxID=1817755 RepID=A0A1F6VGR0_9PROT|nr:MAG: acetylornithine aminotransferase [Candidatus Muproteobacteria bacterium RBG_16_60_9]